MPDVMVRYAINDDPPHIERPLTPGEKRLARSVFCFGLNADLVRIHNKPYWALQDYGTAMTPNGEIWFNTRDFKADFSHDVLSAAWLVHELTHVWQRQNGRFVRLRGLYEQIGKFAGRDPYSYGQVDPHRKFATYNDEQQAALVEDFFRISHRLHPRFGTGKLEDYERVIPFVPKRIAAQRPLRA